MLFLGSLGTWALRNRTVSEAWAEVYTNLIGVCRRSGKNSAEHLQLPRVEGTHDNEAVDQEAMHT